MNSNPELLSVCIPTRNRARYLQEILAAFAKQVSQNKFGPEHVGFHVSDNASDDNTPEVFQGFAQQVSWAKYWRNPSNIGADRNILHVRTHARGQYIWAIGDDELICDKALANLLRLLREKQPGLVIAYNSAYGFDLPTPQVFSDYKDFARACILTNPHALAEHTLISSNIYRADCFDADFALASLQTFYPHMYGMLRALLKKQASVVLPDFPIISIREQQPAPVDGTWVDNLDACWVGYFTWLREEMQMPELNPHAPSDFARRSLFNRMSKHPLRFLRKNWHSLFQPKAYRFVYNRLFRKRS